MPAELANPARLEAWMLAWCTRTRNKSNLRKANYQRIKLISTRARKLEQRQRQREAIKRWKPWTKSTGPISPEGKAAVSRNAFTGRTYGVRALIKTVNKLLQQQRSGLR